MRGIAQYSHIHGPWAFHVERPGPGFYMEPGFYSKPTKKERALSYPKSWNVDGIITREPKKVQKIIATGLPTIIVIQLEEPIQSLPNIINDNISTGRMAAEHLLDRGFKHFAYCGFNETMKASAKGLQRWVSKPTFTSGHNRKSGLSRTSKPLWQIG
jgi:LacI family transcriptional regulator